MKRFATILSGSLFLFLYAPACLAQGNLPATIGRSIVRSGRNTLSSTFEGTARGISSSAGISNQVSRGIMHSQMQAPYISNTPSGPLNPSQILGPVTPSHMSVVQPRTLNPQQGLYIARPAENFRLGGITDPITTHNPTFAPQLSTIDPQLAQNIKELEKNPLDFFSKRIFPAGEERTPFAKALIDLPFKLNDFQDTSVLSPEQLARWEEAKRFFAQLTPEQAKDLHFLSSPAFRQHATVIRSPQATEYGYYIQGFQMEKNYKALYSSTVMTYEKGYISTFAGDPFNGVSDEAFQHLIDNAAPTHDPIFVFIDMHGALTKSTNQFVALANSQKLLYTTDIVQKMQELRLKTGTPELNLLLTSCYGGAFLDEFAALPLSQREGINVFVYTGRDQYNYSLNVKRARGHEPSANIVQEQTREMINQILSNNNPYLQAHIYGQPFNPVQLAVQRASLLPTKEKEFVRTIEGYLDIQRGGIPAFFLDFFQNFSVDDSALYFIARVAKDEATARYGQLYQGTDFGETLLNFREGVAKKLDLNINSRRLNWDKRFGFSPEPTPVRDESDIDDIDLGEFNLEH